MVGPHLGVVKVFHARPFAPHERVAEANPAVVPATRPHKLSVLHCTRVEIIAGGLGGRGEANLVSPPDEQPAVSVDLGAAASVLGVFEVPSIDEKNCILLPGPPETRGSRFKSPLYRAKSSRVLHGGQRATSGPHVQQVVDGRPFSTSSRGIKRRLATLLPPPAGRNTVPTTP